MASSQGNWRGDADGDAVVVVGAVVDAFVVDAVITVGVAVIVVDALNFSYFFVVLSVRFVLRVVFTVFCLLLIQVCQLLHIVDAPFSAVHTVAVKIDILVDITYW